MLAELAFAMGESHLATRIDSWRPAGPPPGHLLACRSRPIEVPQTRVSQKRLLEGRSVTPVAWTAHAPYSTTELRAMS